MNRTIVFILAVLIVLSSCSVSVRNQDTTPRIATSIYPLQDVTNQIVGEHAEVFHLIPAGANPHHFEPPPSIIRQIQDVNLFVGVHPEFDGWIEDLLPESTPRLYLHPNAAHKDNPGEHNHDFNPHFWLSVRTMRTVLPELLEALCELDSSTCPMYIKNFNNYLFTLDSLDREIESQLLPYTNRAFIQWHPAWAGFAKDYGLRIAGTLEYGHGDALPMRSFNKIIQKAKNENIRLVVVGLNIESDAANALVAELDGRLLRLDTIGDPADADRDTYVELMGRNAQLLARGFEE